MTNIKNTKINPRTVLIIVLGLTLILTQLFFIIVDPRPKYCDDCLVPQKVEWINDLTRYLTAVAIIIIFGDVIVLQLLRRNRG